MTQHLSIPRTIYAQAHDAFRADLRRFIEGEIAPNLERWAEQGFVDRAAWLKAGAAGYLCMTMPEAYGGRGLDYRYCALFREEMARAGISGTALGMGLHTDVVAPYILANGTEEQKRHWLPRMARGSTIACIAMTEPGAGSDLKAVSTRAVRESAHYVINGSKIFITNGSQADLVVLVAKTDPQAGAKGVSLILVEAGTPGFTRGPRQEKLSLPMEDTCELRFEDARVPVANLLGQEGRGFGQLMEGLPWERLQLAVSAQCAAEAVLAWTVEHAKARLVFGQPLMALQNTRFKLAECAARVQLGRVFVDRCIELACEGTLDNASAAVAKLWCTELQGRVADECLQLHGGYGILDGRISRAFADARVQRIYGGTSEIMKEIIARRF